jgi:hypothetical protein
LHHRLISVAPPAQKRKDLGHDKADGRATGTTLYASFTSNRQVIGWDIENPPVSGVQLLLAGWLLDYRQR